VAEEISYKRLRDLAREEKAQPGLSALPPEFYSSIQSFLSSKFSEVETNRSLMQMREFENAVAVIKEISAIRQQKILFKAIRNGGVHGKTDDMTREEHELYDRFSTVIGEERGRLDALLSRFESGKHRREAPAPSPAPSRLKKVRFTKDVPAYKGADSQTFGPFKNGDEGALPPEEAEWLLKGKLAELVE
jgi:DNA replication initiation complex subunit (GINS family)